MIERIVFALIIGLNMSSLSPGNFKKFHNFTVLKLAILITIIINLINLCFKFYNINKENIASSMLITYFSISAINIARIEFLEIINPKNKQ